MKCSYCGADNKEDAKFCASCGAELKEKKKKTEEVKVEKAEVKEVKKEPTKVEPVKDGKATASLVLGICSLLIWCLTFILSLIGLILGIASKERSGKRTAGIVLNAIGLFLSTISIIVMFVFYSAFVVAFQEVSRSGDFDRFFEIIEEEYEKQENNNIGSSSTPVITDSSKIVGDEKYGYVKVPTTWVVFTDVDNPNVYQYTDIGEKGYIVTLNTYEDDVAPYTAAQNVKTKIESEGNEAVIKTAIIGKYIAWVVDAKYTDGTYIDIYLFKADDKLHFVSIEGPDDTNENFNIPKTFSLTK
ncbi:MAG: zinc-ribbon domain-containing protein [Bacilli bacterium]|nr:zinc-ribbon domain-containing protein [Bacilli bacterium]